METSMMEKIVNTKEALKNAIANKEQAIIVGNKKLAKKIIRLRKINIEEFQATEDISFLNGGEASVALPNMISKAATKTIWAPYVAAFAIMVLGGLAYYALTKNYDVFVEGGGVLIFNDGEPKIGGRIRFVLKSELLNN
jgi:hypothetical protein